MAFKALILTGVITVTWFSGTFASESPTRAAKRKDEIVEKIGPELTNINYHALMIGINGYRTKKYPALNRPEFDALELGELLEESYLFKVQYLLGPEATRNNIISAIKNLRQSLTPSDALLIYFAGHGEIVKERGYWIPIDADDRNETTWVDLNDVRELVVSNQTRHTLLISDSCFAGAIFNTRSSVNVDEILNGVKKEIIRRPSRYAMTSVPAGRETPDISSFKEQLIGQLQRDEDGWRVFTATELHQNIQDEVYKSASLQTIYKSLGGAAGGDFVFVQKKAVEPDATLVIRVEEPGDAMLNTTSIKIGEKRRKRLFSYDIAEVPNIVRDVKRSMVMVDGRAMQEHRIRIKPGVYDIGITCSGYGSEFLDRITTDKRETRELAPVKLLKKSGNHSGGG